MKKLLFLILLISTPAYAEAKIDCDAAAATMEILQCSVQEYDALEKKRKSTEEQIIERAKKMDNVHLELDRKQFAGNEQSALASKKNFENYRKEECDRQTQWAGMGSIRRVQGILCSIRLTEQRIELLEPYLN